MDAVFLNLVNISITASYIATAVILFRLFLKKAPKAYTCILWLFVAFRLILPVSDSNLLSFTSRFSLIPSTEVLPDTLIDNTIPQFNINVGIEQIDKNINQYLDSRYVEGVTVPANTGSNLINILGMIWMIVFLAIIIYAVGSYIYFRRKTKASIRVKGNTFICDYISTPFILGVIKPKILLPSTLTEKERKYVLAHERAHLRRLDYLWKPIGFILLAVHWFNPIIWISYILFCRDIELACDEYVIKNMSSHDKKAYSTALLHCSVPKKLISVYPLAFGEIGVKERIKTILKYKKPAVITSIIAVLLCIITALCFLSNPQKVSLKEYMNDYITENITYIEIDDGNTFSYVNNESNIEKFLNQFSEIKTSKSPVLDRNFNRGSNVITFYHNDSYISFNFDTDCRQVWIDNNLKPSEVYTVEKPENVFSLLESAKNNSNINQNYKQYAYMNSKNEPVPPKVTLFEENKTFSFFYSAYSSYLAKGTYEIENNKLILKTSDKEYIYAFDISENGIIFDKKHSTALPEYRYSENTEDTDTPVPDRAFFELTNG